MGACDAQQKCSGPPLLKHNACISGACPAGSGQSCGADNFCYDTLYSCCSDNVCYAEAFRTMRLGFTNGQGTQDQVINISDFFTTAAMKPAVPPAPTFMTLQKKIVIIGSPNGAGKTTFAREFLPNEGDCPVFVNADLIAVGIPPFRPQKCFGV